MSNGVTILVRCLKIREQLQLKHIVWVFDQVIYCKVIGLKWRCVDRYNDCVTMLEIFHMIMIYFGITGKNFSEAG